MQDLLRTLTTSSTDAVRIEDWIARYRQRDSNADRWARGYGAIQHQLETQARVFAMADALSIGGVRGDGVSVFDLLHAADRVASAAMWLVVHQTYARNVHLDGRSLVADDFKPNPEGHTGGALNMVPAYVGYMAVNALTGLTRSWIMGQGHCVAAIDSVNIILDNMTEAHASRYSLTDEGLSRYVNDFYSYRLTAEGKQDSPVGSHVNAYTAGGLAEGGYLGFTELQYVHMPLPGERLVAFLSDGAFEEQRGSDWAPRWWRAKDSGLVTPIMIKNGRRIDQRTTMSQQGGSDWFVEHLKLNNFDPLVFDGRDPAAFAWAIFEMEARLEAAAEIVRSRGGSYPVRLPYGVAIAPKGAGFYGEGTNLAHNLPLMSNPHTDTIAAQRFNESAHRLWVALPELNDAVEKLQRHADSGRQRERDHALVDRGVELKVAPDIDYRPVPLNRREPASWTRASPMRAVDAVFAATVGANPHLRPLVGNPDEMKSNRLLATLERLKFRVTDPEPGIPEDVHGSVVTALNEEAVASAALANKGGINLIHTYEAFGTKMHGALRQEVIFAASCEDAGRPQGWLSIPLILTSHTWENAKNEQSHQDPSMAEAMMGELAPHSRVLFPPDYNTAALTTKSIYEARGQLWTVVVPKADTIPDLFTPEDASRLMRQGALRLDWLGKNEPPRLLITAVGAYQLEQALRASLRLRERDIAHSVICMLEPARFRRPRTDREAEHAVPEEVRSDLYPKDVPARIFVSHTRPEVLLGTLQPLNTGELSVGLGFQNRGGTLDVGGMHFVNHCTWAHVLEEASRLLNLERSVVLNEEEMEALDGRRSPHDVII
jgi:phosphoketolase